MSQEKCEAFEEALHWIAMKENTYVQPTEKTLHLARAVLNVWGGYDYRIDPKYQNLVGEFLEDKMTTKKNLMNLKDEK